MYPSETVNNLLSTCKTCFAKRTERSVDQDDIMSVLQRLMSDTVKDVDIQICHDVRNNVTRGFYHARRQLHPSGHGRNSTTKLKDMESESVCAHRHER